MKSRRRPPWPDLLTVLELPGDDVIAIERSWRTLLKRRDSERAFMFTPTIAPHALRWFVERRVRAGRCGNCGYGVGGLPDQDPTGAWRGPARCPECACRWPLVLPSNSDVKTRF